MFRKYTMKTSIEQFINSGSPVMSSIRLLNIYHLFTSTLDYQVQGDVAEIGVFKGFTASFLQIIMQENGFSKALHLYDSFEGLPEPSPLENSPFKAEMFRASLSEVETQFRSLGLARPHIHVGLVEDTLPSLLPDQLSFVHLDLDFMEPMLHAMKAVYPRLTAGAVVVIDDYGYKNLPNVKVVIDEFLEDKPEKVTCLLTQRFPHAIHGYFRKV